MTSYIYLKFGFVGFVIAFGIALDASWRCSHLADVTFKDVVAVDVLEIIVIYLFF